MLVEGVGVVAPQKVSFVLTEAELFALFGCAKDRARHRDYGSRDDKWGRGIKGGLTVGGIGELSQQERPIFIGLLGEYATQQYIDRRFPTAKCVVDTSLLESGDFGVDLQAFGLKMQIKTRQGSSGANLVRRTNNRGKELPIKPHAFVFAEWNGGLTVYLVGWTWARAVREKDLVESVGEWKNASITDSELLPMSRLAHQLNARRHAEWL